MSLNFDINIDFFYIAIFDILTFDIRDVEILTFDTGPFIQQFKGRSLFIYGGYGLNDYIECIYMGEV